MSLQSPRRSIRSSTVAANKVLNSLAKDSLDYRLLNALLECAPNDDGKRVVAGDIIAASTEPNGLHQLAEFYTTGLLLPIRASGRTPQVSYHPSRDPQIKTEAEEIAVDLETAKRDQALLKKYTLYRDGYRCVVTNQWEDASLSIPDVEAIFNPSEDASTSTIAAHILPFSLMSADTNKALFKKCTIWAVIESFSSIEFKELNGDNINSLTNVFTLDLNVHRFFGELKIWFESVSGKSNTYKIIKAKEYILRGVVENGAEVSFQSPNEDDFPLPDPRYLALHAALARVLHMAGMAEHLDDIIRRYEDIRVLSDDSGVEYLDGLLRGVDRYITAY